MKKNKGSKLTKESWEIELQQASFIAEKNRKVAVSTLTIQFNEDNAPTEEQLCIALRSIFSGSIKDIHCLYHD